MPTPKLIPKSHMIRHNQESELLSLNLPYASYSMEDSVGIHLCKTRDEWKRSH